MIRHVKSIVCLAGVLGLLGLAPDTGAQNTTSPGKNAVFASNQVTFDLCCGFQLGATIEKGKSKRVLKVEATYGTGLVAGPNACAAPWRNEIFASVNGVAMNGSIGFGNGPLCPGPECFNTGVFWLDLDAAEAAHPGTFIKRPLDIQIYGDDLAIPFGCILQHGITLAAEMVKK